MDEMTKFKMAHRSASGWPNVTEANSAEKAPEKRGPGRPPKQAAPEAPSEE